ncbi:MAG: glucose-6-phosphate isomerase [Saprospiraceae bacterium]|nr:glucose-6-phosphate isomerase [Saprospiraceae bacterium]
MALKNINPTKTQAWKKLSDAYNSTSTIEMKSLFRQDNNRKEKYTITYNNFTLDFSKNRITDEIFQYLIDLANETDLADGIQKMFSGDKINETENRAVLHTALRSFSGKEILLDGTNVMLEVKETLEKMKNFTNDVVSGKFKGYTGKSITDIVNIGIGGSDLGPRMVVDALQYYKNHLKTHFISNIDGDHVMETIKNLDPETTLFIIVSKTFTTQETLTNALTVKKWFLQSAKESDIKHNFVAVSTNLSKVYEFGIDKDNVFTMWDWVGGRYSLSSAIGLSIMVAVGAKHFREMLEGMHSVDEYFRTSPLEENISVILGLLGIWYANFMGAQTEAILPYDQNLQYLASYLQQASMESNGKMVDRSGKKVTYSTGSILWGGAGTNSQHSFFQLLHQGTHLIPCDFIIAANPTHHLGHHHDLLVANVLAQCEALMRGKSADVVREELAGQPPEKIEQLTPFKVFTGNRPSTMIMIDKLTPYNLGRIIALYEHKIFVQGYIWNIFSFDQFGVELGKQLAKAIEPEITGHEKPEKHDASTNNLLLKFKSWKTY